MRAVIGIYQAQLHIINFNDPGMPVMIKWMQSA